MHSTGTDYNPIIRITVPLADPLVNVFSFLIADGQQPTVLNNILYDNVAVKKTNSPIGISFYIASALFNIII